MRTGWAKISKNKILIRAPLICDLKLLIHQENVIKLCSPACKTRRLCEVHFSFSSGKS